MKNRKKRLIFYFGLTIFSLLLTILPIVYNYIEPNNLIILLEKDLKRVTGKNVYVESLSISATEGFWIIGHGILMVNDRGGLIARVEELKFRISLEDVLKKKLYIKSAEIKGASIRLYTGEERKKEEKGETSKRITRALNRLTAEDVDAEAVWVMVCKDESHVTVSQCYTAFLEEIKASIIKGSAQVSASGTIGIPNYSTQLEIETSAKIEPLGPDILAEGSASLKIPSLLLRDSVAGGENFLQTDGEIDLGISGKWVGKKANTAIKVETKAVNISWKNKRLPLQNTSASLQLALDGNFISAQNADISTGPAGKEITAKVYGILELEENKPGTGERKIKVEKASAKLSFEAKELSSVLDNPVWGSRKWSAGGYLKGSASASFVNDLISGEFGLEGEAVKVQAPEYYGAKPVYIEKFSMNGTGSWPEGQIDLGNIIVKAGDSVINGDGEIKLKGHEIDNATFSVTSPLIRYESFRPYLPERRMKAGSRRFFFGELKTAVLEKVVAQIKWNRSMKGKKAFLENGFEGYAEVGKTLMDFGNAPAKVESAKISLYGGNMSFFDIKGDVGGASVTNLRVDIESLGQKPKLVIYLHDPLKAENLISFLSAADFNIGGFFNDKMARGWMYPSVVVEIPLSKGAKALLTGGVNLKDFNLSVAGMLPLMEGINGHVDLSGRAIKSTQLNFKIGKMPMSAFISMRDFEAPDGNIGLTSPQALPAEFFNAIPPSKAKIGEKGSPGKKSPDNKKVSFRVALQAPKGRYRTLVFKDLDTIFEVDDKGVTFKRLKMSFAGGQFRTDPPARVLFDGPVVKFKFVAKGMDPTEFMKIFKIKQEILTGNMDIDGAISAKGANFDELVANQQGKIHFDIENGQIEESNILYGAFNLINLDFTEWKARKLGYRSITGDVKITKGVLQSDNIAMNGFFMKIVISGEINLPKDKLEMDIGLVPLGMIQSIVGSVPLVKSFFESHSGKNYFAYYFRVKGSLDDYKVVQLGPQAVKEQLNYLINSIINLGKR